MPEYIHHFADGKAKLAAIKGKFTDPLATALALGLEGACQRGNRIATLCPWHAERTPSCMLELCEGMLRAHCYGCGRNGDVLDLAAATLGLSTRGADFPRVIEHLSRLPCPPNGTTPRPESHRERSTTQPLGVRDEDFAVIGECILDLCPLSTQPDVCEYVRSRDVLDVAVHDRWAALPADGDEQAELIDEIIITVGEKAWDASGLAREGGSLAYPQHRLVVPWRDPLGYIVNLQRRLVQDSSDIPKYVSATQRSFAWPYGVESLLDAPPEVALMFVEGAVDVLAVRALCRSESTGRLPLGLPGVAGWREEWRHLGSGRQVTLAFDADDAGDRARQRVAQDLTGAGVPVRGSKPGRGCKDWADLLMLEGGA